MHSFKFGLKLILNGPGMGRNEPGMNTHVRISQLYFRKENHRKAALEMLITNYHLDCHEIS